MILEKFSPTRFVGRMLGMGDIQALLDMAKRLETEGNEDRLKRISHGKMNMEDFYFQIEEATKAGGLRNILENMPGFSGMVKEESGGATRTTNGKVAFYYPIYDKG